MEWLSPLHQEQIRQQIAQIGFADFETILRKIEPCEDPQDPLVKSIIFHDLPREDTVTASVFLLVKERSANEWYIDELHTSVQMDSVRSEIGVVVTSQAHYSRDGPFPSLAQIQGEVEKIVLQEKEKEAAFLSLHLEKEISALGFEGYFDMLRSARQEAGFIVLSSTEPLGANLEEQLIAVQYQLIVTPPADGRSAFLGMVRGSLVGLPESPNYPNFPVEQAFYKLNGQLPRKEEMLKELLAVSKLTPDVYERVRKRFSIGEQTLGSRQKSYSQGRLGL